MMSPSRLVLSALALPLLACAFQARAQQMPGDDYVNTCTTTYTTTYTTRYGGLSTCSAYSASSGFVQLYEWVAPQLPNRRTLFGFAPAGGLLSCDATVPYYDTLTTVTPNTTCSLQPRQPFLALNYYADYCTDTPGRTVGELYWAWQAGDSYEVQWRYADQTQFSPYWSGSTGAPDFYLAFDYTSQPRRVFRLRATRGGATGSWSYISPTCERDRHER